MDQNPTAGIQTVERSSQSGGMSSQLFGSNFKKDNLEKRVQELMRESTEFHELKKYMIDKGTHAIQSEGLIGRYGSAIPAIIAVILSYFVDVSSVPFLGQVARNFATWLFPNSKLFDQGITPVNLWWLPFLVFGVFMLCSELSYRKLMREVSTKGVSQEIIERITARYASIVDSVGTALPLLGAAILLISIKEGSVMFLGFSVPFEIKAITILAIAKLFEIVFDSQGLKFAELREDLNDLEKEYFSERDDIHQRAILQQLHDGFSRKGPDSAAISEKFSKEEAAEIRTSLQKASEFSESISKNVVIMKNAIVEMSKTNVHDSELLKELQNTSHSLTTALSAATQTAEYSEIMKRNLEAMRNLMSEMNNIKYPDESILKELQITAHMMTETVNSLKDAQAIKGLDNLAYIAGKR
jgi:methyl-accepting chemotaxis protein